MDCHAQCLELWRFLLPFKVNILDYLNFNSKNFRLEVKFSKCNHFLLNSIQEVIQKTQSSSLPFSFSYNFLKYYSFISQNNRIRVKSLKNKLFRQKSFMNYTQKTKKKKFSLYILGLVVVSISLSDESIKILEI